MAAPVQIGFCFDLLKPHMYEVKIVHTKNQVRQCARTILSPVVAYTQNLELKTRAQTFQKILPLRKLFEFQWQETNQHEENSPGQGANT